MRLLNRATRNLIVAATAAVFAAALQAQTPPPASSSSSSSSSSQAPAESQTPTQTQPTNANGGYISIDPLAGVKYDNRWDISVGLASGHIHAGPNLREGADLGGLDISGSYWLTRRLGLEASGRGYLGTSGTLPAAAAIGESGVFVAQYMFLGGVEYLGPHNKHIALIPHALIGGAYADFNREINKQPLIPGQPVTGPSGPAGFYDNQFALGGAFGGHIDLNRSAHWVFRITPDALLTGYDGTSQYPHTQWNFGISVGAQYKFKGKR
jgi:hypothetical protein